MWKVNALNTVLQHSYNVDHFKVDLFSHRLQEILSQVKDGDVLKKILNPHLGMLEHL